MIADTALFFGLWLRKPLQIAAICPSGAPVAAAMARLVDPARPGPVLELGAGTGSITRGLLAAGWPLERIIAYERESRLVDILRREIRGIRAVVGDATLIWNGSCTGWASIGCQPWCRAYRSNGFRARRNARCCAPASRDWAPTVIFCN
jgi:hypothetical protein